MPELPEVEITARRLGAALAGAEVESTLAPGMVAVKTLDPTLNALEGRRDRGRRPGRQDADRPSSRPPATSRSCDLLVHLMSAGRLQVFDKRASLKDRASRVLIRLADGRELRLREFGTKQRAWAKLYRPGGVEADEMVATLGPEAWPAPPLDALAAAIDQPRQLHPLLRDQRAIAGIGRSWVDEILWEARLSPFRKGSDLDAEEVGAPPRRARTCSATRSTTTRRWSASRSPTSCRCRSRSTGARASPARAAARRSRPSTSPSTRPTTAPRCQTGGRVLKDRRLSRLLK